MNILLVDDESHYLSLTRDFLEDQGWSVVTAENGEDGLVKLAASQVDIIVSDVYMPLMDGLKFHKAVRAMAAHAMLPFLFVSAYDDNFTLSAVSISRNEAFLKKGRPASELRDWIVYLTTPIDRRGNPPNSSTIVRTDRPAAHPTIRDPRSARRGDGTTR
jgi:CheY-like chemotaxis protein